ncbi:hypothetical protein BTVI_90142 [Pitangus sulphuratus]|nr:hypothetical protein BTVI_90142 [Pitangus sulphuratus]
MMTTNLPPPSFCYILTVQSGEVHVEVDEEEQISNLYQPPAVHGLKEILRIDGSNKRCSFGAQVLYLRLQEPSVHISLVDVSNSETYEVQSVLGKEVGLLNCYVHSVTSHPNCVALEEIVLLEAAARQR